MGMGRPKAALILTREQREQLEGMVKSRSLPAGLVSRARIVLMSAAGKTNQEIARQLGMTNATVGKWRGRFLQQDVTGLHDELRPVGRAPSAMNGWLDWCAKPWRPSPKTARTGVSVRSRAKCGWPSPRCIASGARSVWSLIGSGISSSPTIPFSSRRFGISWGCISTRRKTQ